MENRLGVKEGMSKDLGPLPKVHQRSWVVTKAENEINAAINAAIQKHGLTMAEQLQVINACCSREIAHIAKFAIREERNAEQRQSKPIEVEPTPEGLAAAEKELAETNEAIAKIRALYDSPLWEDAKVAGLNFSDACDDMNDHILAFEKTLREQKYLPGSIPVGSGATFHWDGERLRLDNLRSRNPLSSQSKGIRVKLLGRIPDLVKVLTKASPPV